MLFVMVLYVVAHLPKRCIFDKSLIVQQATDMEDLDRRLNGCWKSVLFLWIGCA